MKEKMGLLNVPIVENCKECMLAQQSCKCNSDQVFCLALQIDVNANGQIDDCPIIRVPEEQIAKSFTTGIVTQQKVSDQLAEINYANGWNDFRSTVLNSVKNVTIQSNEAVTTASINKRFTNGIQHLIKYKQEHGDTLVPVIYICNDGFHLGTWVKNLRRRRTGNLKKGELLLTEQEISALNEIGMVWNVAESRWESGFEHAKRYYQVNKHLNAPYNYVDPEDGFKLGMWLSNQRHAKISQEHEQILNNTFPNWKNAKCTDAKCKNMPTEIIGDLRIIRWSEGYKEAKKYFELCNNLVVSDEYVTKSGFPLGAWLHQRRLEHANHKLSASKKSLLDELGMIWNEKFAHSLHHTGQQTIVNRTILNELDPQKLLTSSEHDINNHSTQKWLVGYMHAVNYYEQFSNINVPSNFVCADGYKLGVWVKNQRNTKRCLDRGKTSSAVLTSDRIKLLDILSMRW